MTYAVAAGLRAATIAALSAYWLVGIEGGGMIPTGPRHLMLRLMGLAGLSCAWAAVVLTLLWQHTSTSPTSS